MENTNEHKIRWDAVYKSSIMVRYEDCYTELDEVFLTRFCSMVSNKYIDEPKQTIRLIKQN